MSALKDANLAVKFVLELIAIAAFAYWGSQLPGVLVAVLVGVAAPAAAVALWGVFCAPTSARRLPTRLRVPFELGVFALAGGALVAAGRTGIAAGFGAVVIVNAVLLVRLGQLER